MGIKNCKLCSRPFPTWKDQEDRAGSRRRRPSQAAEGSCDDDGLAKLSQAELEALGLDAGKVEAARAKLAADRHATEEAAKNKGEREATHEAYRKVSAALKKVEKLEGRRDKLLGTLKRLAAEQSAATESLQEVGVELVDAQAALVEAKKEQKAAGRWVASPKGGGDGAEGAQQACTIEERILALEADLFELRAAQAAQQQEEAEVYAENVQREVAVEMWGDMDEDCCLEDPAPRGREPAQGQKEKAPADGTDREDSPHKRGRISAEEAAAIQEKAEKAKKEAEEAAKKACG